MDGLRFFAFLVVFAHHALPQDAARWVKLGASPTVASWLEAATMSGGYGVDLFFCLSSYLITELLVRELEQTSTLDVGRFLVRRALRIWPLYFAFLLLCSGLVPKFRSVLTHQELLAFVLFVGNWQTAFFGYPRSVAAPLWSVSIEEQFYLVWPWIVRAAGIRRLLGVCAAMIGVGLLTRFVLAWLAVPHPGVWCNTLARVDAIALGAGLSVWGHQRGWRWQPRWSTGMLLIAAAVGTAVVITHFISPAHPRASFHQVWSYAAVDAACALLVWVVVRLRDAGSPLPLLTSAPLVYLGRISYGLYVFHSLGLKLSGSIAVRVLGSNPLLGRLALGLALTLGMAMVSYRFLERPFLRLKRRFTVVASRPD